MNTSIRNCPVCGQRTTRTLYRPKASPGAITQCNRCRMVYVETIDDPHALFFDGPFIYKGINNDILTSSDLNAVKDSWEFAYLREDEIELSCLRRNTIRTLEKLECYLNGKRNPRILDFGSGFGFFLATAKEIGWDTYGIEPLPASAVYARAKFGLKIITDTLHEGTFPNEYFDAIVSLQVFEHIPYPDENMRILARLLRHGGIVLIEVPRYDTWSMRLMGSHHRHYVQDHINFYTYPTLRMQLEHHGFEVMESYRPQRILSINHLYTRWIAQKFPNLLFQFYKKVLQRSGLWNRTIGVDIGDMLAMIGRKK